MRRRKQHEERRKKSGIRDASSSLLIPTRQDPIPTLKKAREPITSGKKSAGKSSHFAALLAWLEKPPGGASTDLSTCPAPAAASNCRPAEMRRIKSRREAVGGISGPMTIRIVPGRLRKARLPQKRPSSSRREKPAGSCGPPGPPHPAEAARGSGFAPGSFGKNHDLPPGRRGSSPCFNRLRSAMTRHRGPRRSSRRRGACRPKKGILQQLAFQHVAAAGQQGNPDKRVEGGLVPRGD